MTFVSIVPDYVDRFIEAYLTAEFLSVKHLFRGIIISSGLMLAVRLLSPVVEIVEILYKNTH